MKENRDYPALVKDVRRQLALSQEDLARALGVSYATINRWENGQVRPSKLGKAQFERLLRRYDPTRKAEPAPGHS